MRQAIIGLIQGRAQVDILARSGAVSQPDGGRRAQEAAGGAIDGLQRDLARSGCHDGAETHEMRDLALALDAFFIIGLLLLFVLHVAEKKTVKHEDGEVAVTV